MGVKELRQEHKNLGELYKQYANQIKRFLICLTADVELAEELMQETFYQVVKCIDRYDGSCKISVWLCQIAKHLYYDYLKKQKPYKRISLDEWMMVSIQFPSLDKNPEEVLLHQEKMKNIAIHIENLSEPYKQIFLLRIFNEMSFKEIGDVFKKSENWARVTYYRAKEQLKSNMERDQDEL